MTTRLAVAATALALCTLAATKSSNFPSRLPSKLPSNLSVEIATEDEPTGLSLELRGRDGRAQQRRVRFAALRVDKGKSAGAFLAPGAFTAVFRGRITVPLRDRYRFAFEGFGAAKLEIGGKTVFDTRLDARGVHVAKKKTRLKKGANDFVLSYESAKDGSAALRLLWEGYGFGRELVPPRVLSTSADVARATWLGSDGVRGGLAARGRALVAERQCLACHAVEGRTRMPELRRRGVKLTGIGARVQGDWLAAWLLDPTSLRPAARMPRLLRGEGAAAQARDLAAWLASSTEGAGDLPTAAQVEGDPAAGGKLFARLGCVACHTRPEREADESGERIPLRFVAAKWKKPALVAFLQNPAAHERWVRMPDFGLNLEEAAQIASFLMAKGKAALPKGAGRAQDGDAARGRALAEKLGCAACHSIAEMHAAPAKPWPQVCAADDSTTCAHFDASLGEAEREALRALQSADAKGESFGYHSPAEYAERQVAELRCAACHGYDGAPDEWTRFEAEVADLAGPADPEEVDQVRPHLTWVGEKLRSEWFTGFLKGKIEKPRTWLHARMSRFRSRARLLADGFAAMHGVERTKKSQIAKPAPQLVRAGAKIAGAKGHACTTCHSFGKHGATMVFESPGINLVHASRRLRPDFYMRWMLDPQRFDPRTKMTKFADEKARTQLEDFDGDARQQFEAVWQYLLGGDKMGAPSQR